MKTPFPRLPKHYRLFWKILLLFWVTLILTIVVNVVITQKIVETELEKRFDEARISELSHNSATIFESGGPKALAGWTRRQKHRKGIFIVLKYTSGEPVLQQTKFQQKSHKERPALPSPVIKEIISSENNRYIVELHFTREASEAIRKNHSFHGVRLIVTLLILSFASWILSRHLARPIKSLSLASREFAGGNLQVRMSDKMADRKDELGQLAKDFDHMAESIETLVTQQRQLLQDISHELRTPLTRQRLALELARRKGADAEFIQQIEQQNEKIDALLSELLSLERMDNPQDRHEVISVEGLINTVINQCEIEASAKSIRLESDAPLTHTTHIKGTASLLERAIENILRNAIKYSPKNTHIQLSLTSTPEFVTLTIADSGPGVKEDNLERIFNPFFREDQARTHGTGGIGLGLSIAQKAIQLHSGTIEAHNRADGGLSIAITLPFTL